VRGKFVNLKLNNDFVETYKTTTDSHKSERQPSTSSCEESLECPEDIGVPIQKDGSQPHVSRHCDEEDDDIWREVSINIFGVQGPSQIQTVVCHAVYCVEFSTEWTPGSLPLVVMRFVFVLSIMQHFLPFYCGFYFYKVQGKDLNRS